MDCTDNQYMSIYKRFLLLVVLSLHPYTLLGINTLHGKSDVKNLSTFITHQSLLYVDFKNLLFFTVFLGYVFHIIK